MTLISSISGIRGTVNGINQTSLTPIDVVKYVSAYGTWINTKKKSCTVVVGRDGRHSSLEIEKNLIDGLISQGLKVFKIGLCPTPQLYFGVHHLRADGGIMITGSHNPPDYNGFKMMLGHGPFFGQDIKKFLCIRPGKKLNRSYSLVFFFLYNCFF